MPLLTGKIADIVSGKLIGPDNIPISNFFIDSRKATLISGKSLFIALGGLRTDGHKYIEGLYDKGIRAFIINDQFKLETIFEKCTDASFIITADTLASLHLIAAFKRSIFEGTVIAITGSNGKTIVKEWFSDILGNVSGVLRSPRSYNSQTGVPLSVVNLENRYSYGVFEAGMSHPGEIQKLERIIKPDIAVFTNIGDAHQENFINIQEKVKEKLDLFKNCNTIIYSPDHSEIHSAILEDNSLRDKELFTWSFSDDSARVRFSIDKGDGGDYTLLTIYGGGEFQTKLLYSDNASVQNVAIVISMLLYLGIDEDVIKENIQQIRPVEMRMAQKEGTNACTLIEDYYNSDPAALSIALDYLKDIPGDSRRVILSDFVQQSVSGTNVYSEVGEMLNKAEISNTICIGEDISNAREFFSPGTMFFQSTEEFLKWYSPGKFKNEIILLKGARKFEFENISSVLELKAHITTLQINLDNLLRNLGRYRSKLTTGTKIMAMVKAFAYGAGPKQISEWLVNKGIDYLAVAYIDEGKQLREAGISSGIMVMNPDMSSSRLLLDFDLEPEIFSIEMLTKFLIELGKENIENYPVHIKIDTGMHRLGFDRDDIPGLIDILKNDRRIRVASVFTHLAASEDPEYDEETRKQVNVFTEICETIESSIAYKFIRHVLNSAGIIRFPEYQFDMVRMGIGLFGTGYIDIENTLAVVSFRSCVSQVKKVRAGEGIGYGLTDKADSDRDIAIIPIGYADGLNRRLGNGNGRVYLKSAYAHIVGRVCMDMCMIDVTGIDVIAGDIVEIFGEKIPVSEVAEKCDTIPYEILTSIPPRVKRVYLYE